MINRIGYLFGSLILAVLPLPALAVSTFFTVGGLLKDSNGDPVSLGTIPVRTVFYADESSTTTFGTFDTFTIGNVQNGVFSASISIPDTLLGQRRIWYELALDTGHDGFDSGDFFQERFQVNVVDVGQPLLPTERFDTCGGSTSSVATGIPPNKVWLSPFVTPPGGVRFNHVISSLSLTAVGGKLINVGVYDVSGELLAESGPTTFPSIIEDPYGNATFGATGELEGAQLYYIAITSTTNLNFPSSNGMAWPYRDNPTLPRDTTNAVLPEQVDDIAEKATGPAINVGLWYISEEKTAGQFLKKR